VTMPPDFDEVQLTKEETELAIFDARCEKYWELQRKKKLKEKASQMTAARLPFTVNELREFVLKTNPWFQLDEQALPVFELLCLYFSNDKRFESYKDLNGNNYSLTKGICLVGPVGVGKTEILNIFRFNKRQCFHMITVFDIESMLQKDGTDAYQNFIGPVPGWGHHEKFFYQPEIGWAFDDVGRESVVFDFGNKTDAISKIFQTRYFKKIPFSSLHITTNRTPKELEARYDEAVRSRLREMMNYIIYKGNDRRK